MQGKKPKAYRRHLPPEVYRDTLRRRLANLYRADSRYQMIVLQDLRPHWRKANRPNKRGAVPSLHSLRAAVEEGRPSPDWGIELLLPAVGSYVEAVHSKVKFSLRLTLNGNPADWVAEFVHLDVTMEDPFSFSGDDNGLEFPILPEEDLSIDLKVWPTFVTLEMFVDGRPLIIHQTRSETPPYEVVDVYSVLEEDLSADVVLGHSPKDWDELERVAQRYLHAGISAMRERFERRYPRVHNPSALSRQEETLHQLFQFLFHKRVEVPAMSNEGRAIRERWRKLTQAMEIDLPPVHR